MLIFCLVFLYVVALAYFATLWSPAVFPHATEFPNYIDRAIPIFLACIALELWATRGSGFTRADSLTSMALGSLQQLVNVVRPGKALLIVPYILVWEHVGKPLQDSVLLLLPSWFCDPKSLPSNFFWWTQLAIGFFGVELAFYWYHRLGHEVNIFWAAHVAHHSSEEYNLTTALRQGALQYTFAFLFYCPLGVVVPPATFSALHYVNRIYQFFIHTRTVGKLPRWAELVLNTPSHHRVHHGANPKYIDKNYGGILIIFDRMFGTFEEESEPVRYGLTTNLDSFSPIWANLHHWAYMRDLMVHSKGGIWQRLQILLVGPGWSEKGPLPVPPVRDPNARSLRDTGLSRGAALHALFLLLQMIVVLKFLTPREASLPKPKVGILVMFHIATAAVMGMLLDRRPSAQRADVFRTLFFVPALAIVFRDLAI